MRLAAVLSPGPLGELTCSPDSLAGFRVGTGKGGEEKGGGELGERTGKKCKGGENGKEGGGTGPPPLKSWLRACVDVTTAFRLHYDITGEDRY